MRPTLREQRELWLAPLERRYLVDLLTDHQGNVRAAAAAAGIDPVTMYRLLRKRGVAVRREAHAQEELLPARPDPAEVVARRPRKPGGRTR